MSELCPCGSSLSYEECCQPYIIENKVAPSPAALMRSRYTAYVLKNASYLIATWHPDCQPEQWRDSLQEGFTSTHWQGLQVISETGGRDNDEGFVEFAARFTETGDEHIHLIHERSRFLRLKERWYYIDGIKPQTGRNDACPCGSGKKYKKCCGK